MKLIELNPNFVKKAGIKFLAFECPDHKDIFYIPINGPHDHDIDSEDFNTLTMKNTVNGNCGILFNITKGEIKIVQK